jgi:hypothetical protein
MRPNKIFTKFQRDNSGKGRQGGGNGTKYPLAWFHARPSEIFYIKYRKIDFGFF